MKTPARLIRYISFSFALSILLFTACQNSGGEAETPEEETAAEEQGSDEEQAQEQQFEMPEPATDVSEAEMEKFVAALQEIQKIQQGGQSKMIEAIEGEGMQVQRFQEIMQQKQNPADSSTISAEEEQQFSDVNQSLQDIQMGLQEESEKAIENAGLSVDRYQSIMLAVRQDTSMQRQVQQLMMQGVMKEQGS